MATWVRLRHKTSGAEVVVLNTHLDASAAQARERGAEIVRDAAERMFPTLPVLLTGDFNSEPDAAPHRVLSAAGWVDTWTTAARTGPAWSTFNRYDRRAPLPGPRIDRIYARPGLPVVAVRGEHLSQPGRRAPQRPLPGAGPGATALTLSRSPATVVKPGHATAHAGRGRRGRCVPR